MRVTLVTETYFPQVNGVSRTLGQLVRALTRMGDHVQVVHPDYGEPARERPRLPRPLGSAPVLPRAAAPPAAVRRGMPRDRRLRARPHPHRHRGDPGPRGAAARARQGRSPSFRASTRTSTSTPTTTGSAGSRGPSGATCDGSTTRPARPTSPRWPRSPTWKRRGFNGSSSGPEASTARCSAPIDPARRGPPRPRLRPRRRGDRPREPDRGREERRLPRPGAGLRSPRSRPTVRLLIVGDGPARGELEKTLGDSARFAGYRTGDDLADHYAAADLFAFASLTETFGNVILEAMASGLPVVAVRAGGPGEIVRPGETGFLVEPDAPSSAFAEAPARPGRRRRIAERRCRPPRGDTLCRRPGTRSWASFASAISDIVEEASTGGTSSCRVDQRAEDRACRSNGHNRRRRSPRRPVAERSRRTHSGSHRQAQSHPHVLVLLAEKLRQRRERPSPHEDQVRPSRSEVGDRPFEPRADLRMIAVREGHDQRVGEDLGRHAVEPRIEDQGALDAPDEQVRVRPRSGCAASIRGRPRGARPTGRRPCSGSSASFGLDEQIIANLDRHRRRPSRGARTSRRRRSIGDAAPLDRPARTRRRRRPRPRAGAGGSSAARTAGASRPRPRRRPSTSRRAALPHPASRGDRPDRRGHGDGPQRPATGRPPGATEGPAERPGEQPVRVGVAHEPAHEERVLVRVGRRVRRQRRARSGRYPRSRRPRPLEDQDAHRDAHAAANPATSAARSTNRELKLRRSPDCRSKSATA